MKNRINKITLFTVAVLLLLTGASCKKSFFSDANKNPNAPDPDKVSPNALLPVVEASLAYTVGGELSRYASLLTQQTSGYSNQAAAYYGYTFTTNDFDAVWGNLYTSVLLNNARIREISDAKGYNLYGGISRVLTAYTLQLIVDNWGAAPYSQALKGDGNGKPSFDTGAGLYDTIQTLLNRAITLMSDPDPGAITPGADDFMYGGNADKWIKFAHALKARIYIHQSKGNATMANNALAEIALAFESAGDNAIFRFGTTPTTANPVYQFNQQRFDLDYASTTLAAALDADDDPRYNVWIEPDYTDENFVGMKPYYGSINSPVEFITYDELLFIKAEATLRSGGTIGAAQAAYQAGIRENMTKFTAMNISKYALDSTWSITEDQIDDYIAANGTLPGTTSAAIDQVAKEAFTALYLNPEAWTLWRRTGVPELEAVSGDDVPRRLLYPQSEISNNGANTPSVTLFTPKIFWDN
ncbi:MAG TPA: SusD/RagB family nutrient-binding outer membrane lipoprotein [Chitinophagaceae bacterium]|nr:SusD/RagB family nutrient-binding outer membrane lipoprotein [Chitinophagaceae bacterium]